VSLVKAMVKLGTITYNKFGDIPSIKGVASMMFAIQASSHRYK